MAAVNDFRIAPFDPARVVSTGKYVGRNVYWHLYSIENLVRIIIHSVLSVQIAPNWWPTATGSTIQNRVKFRRADYAGSPWHSTPGNHDIYYVDLSDLTEIIRANRNLFVLVIADIDNWIADLERIRLPRNIVGHMNWPSHVDRRRISVAYADLEALVVKLSRAGWAMLIP